MKKLVIYTNTLWPPGEALIESGITERHEVDEVVTQFKKTFRAKYKYVFADTVNIKSRHIVDEMAEVLTFVALEEAGASYADYYSEFNDHVERCDTLVSYALGSEPIIPAKVFGGLLGYTDLRGNDLNRFFIGLTINNSAQRVCEEAYNKGEALPIKALFAAIDKKIKTYDLITVTKKYAPEYP